MLSIQAITFDLDDTLWDIGAVIAEAEKNIYQWLSTHCPKSTERYSLVDMQRARVEVVDEFPELSHDLSGLRWLAFKKVLSSTGYDDSWADRAFERFMVMRNNVVLYPDALPALQTLAQVYPLASLTNGNADLERIGIDHHFSVTISAKDYGVAKPHQDIFLAACRALHCEPREVLHIGDSPEHDVLGAANAGLRTVWLNRRGETWQHSEKADFEAADLNEVLQFFESTTNLNVINRAQSRLSLDSTRNIPQSARIIDDYNH